MQEIEMKFKVDNITKLKEKLKELNCNFSKVLNQKDTIFVQDINNTTVGEGSIFIRIRSVNDKVELCLKKRTKKIMESKEIEFEVSDFDKAYDFVKTLGLTKWVTVEKKRIATKYKEFNICIDEVTRLGKFVEIEIVTAEENKTDYYENEIVKVCKELNINTDNRINSHYDTMIDELNKQNG